MGRVRALVHTHVAAAIFVWRERHAAHPLLDLRFLRVPGFTGPITLSAKGGQIAPKEEGRTRVYAQLPQAKADQLQVTGSIHSLILTNLQKHRVDVTAVGIHEGKRVSLTRSFELEVQTAFNVSAEPAVVKVDPGAAGNDPGVLARRAVIG